MLLTVDTRDALAVAVQVQSDYRLMFPEGDRLFVPLVFGWAIDCFTGRLPDYFPIDARYHDFEHTLQGTLCFSTLLRGRFQAGEKPAVPEEMFRLGLLAILLHDTGYLKRRDDPEGTGAKYTLTHVSRSCEFAAALLAEKGYTSAQIHAVQNMIRCTGVDTDLEHIEFSSPVERIAGFALGTGDLLGQMAAPDYVEKLPILFEEFVESARFNGKPTHAGPFLSAADLMAKTPSFWEKYVKLKIQHDFLGLFRFLANPFPEGPNHYVQRIEANIARLREQLAASQ